MQPDPEAGVPADEAQRLRDELATTHALLDAATVPATSGMPEVLGRLARITAERLDRTRVAIHLPDEAGTFVTAAVFGGPPFRDGNGLAEAVSAELCQAIEAREAVVVDLAAEGCSAEAAIDVERFGARQVLLAPLKVHDDLLVGCMTVDDADCGSAAGVAAQARRPFTRHDIEVATALAEQAAVTIEQTRLFVAQERRNAQLRALSEIDDLVTSTLDVAEIVARGLVIIEEHLNNAAATAWSFDSRGGRLTLVGAYGFPDTFRDDFAEGIGVDEPYPVAHAVRTGEPQVVENVTPDVPLHQPVRETYARYGMDLRTLVTVPLIANGSVIGGLTLAWDRPNMVSEEDLSFVTTIANRFSSALRCGQIFDAERNARKLANRELQSTQVLLRSAILLGGKHDIQSILTAVSEVMREIVAGVRTCVSLKVGGKLTTIAMADSSGAEPIECAHLRGPAPHFLQVMEQGESAIVDYDEQPQLRLREDCDCHLALVVPLMLGEEAIGTISLDRPGERHEFGLREVELVSSIARGAAIAIENARLLQRERETTRLGEALGEIDRSVHATLDVDQMLARVVVEAADALGCDSSTLLVREDGEWVIRHVHQFPESAIGLCITDGEFPAASEAERTRASAVVDDADETTIPEIYRQHAVRSMMVTPLCEQGEIAALLLFCHHELTHVYTEREQEFARLLSASLGLGLENARLYQAEHAARVTQARRAEEMTLLRRIADIGTTTRDRSLVAERQLAVLASFLGLRAALVMVPDDASEVLQPIASFGLPSSALQNVSFDALDDATAVVRVHETGAPVYIADVASDTTLSPNARKRLLRRGVGSMAVLPLQVSRNIMGTLTLVRAEAHERKDEEESLLRSIASEVALGIQNAELFAAERKRRRRIQALHDIMEVAVSSLDVAASAQRILDHLVKRHDFEIASLWLVRGEYLELVASVGYPPDALAGVSAIPIATPNGELQKFLANESAFVPDASAALEPGREVCECIGIDGGCYVILPLVSRGRTIGRLHFGWREPQSTAPADMEFCSSIAAEVGIVIENTRLYESEREIAEALQETLVVLRAQIPGLVFSRAYESATYESGRVGGDFIDVFTVRPGLVGLSLGDVSGKGIEAAVTTSLIRTTLRVLAIDGLAPAEVASKANVIIRRLTEVDSFVTLWFGLLNTETGHLRYVAAGHPPALMLSADGQVHELQCSDPILGAFEDASYFECQMVMAPGERLFLYSDGATEARTPSGEFFGHDGLVETLRRHSDIPTAELSDAVMRVVVAFSEGVLRDDVALFAIEPTELDSAIGGASDA